MYNLNDIKNLDSLYTLDPGAVTDALRLKEGAFQQSEQDLQKTRLANMFDEQRNPYLIEQARLANEQLGAQLPGIQADSAIKQRSNDMGAATYPDALKAARAKFMSEASDSHIKELTNKFQEMAFNGETPEIKQKGIEGLRFTKDMIAEREKIKLAGDKSIAGIRAQGEEARKTQQQAIDAGKYREKAGGGAGVAGIQQALASGKLSYEKAATLLTSAGSFAQVEAMGMPDGPEKEQALQKAAFLIDLGNQYAKQRSTDMSEAQRARQVGTPDIGAVSGGKVPVVQEKPREPLIQTQQPAIKTSADVESWVQRAMKANPGMSREAVIQQGKALGKF